jgi:VanZ family protein
MLLKSSTLVSRIALVVALLGIGYLAVTPSSFPAASSANDKLLHIAAFLLLAFLADFAYPRRPWNWRKFLPLLGFGLVLETLQYFLPHRFFSLMDLGADALGLMLYPWLRHLLVKTTTLRFD